MDESQPDVEPAQSDVDDASDAELEEEELEGEAERSRDRRRAIAGSMAITAASVGYAVYFLYDTWDHSWRIKLLPVGFSVLVLFLATFEVAQTVRKIRTEARLKAQLNLPVAPRLGAGRFPPTAVAATEILVVLLATWLLIISIGNLPLGLTMAVYGGLLFAVLERRKTDAKGLLGTITAMGLLGYLIARFFPGVG